MTTTNTIGATKTDENTHPFAGPEFVVFPHAKREKIRQALLDAHQVYHSRGRASSLRTSLRRLNDSLREGGG